MSELFSGCSSLISIPDISKWNTKNITNLEKMLSGCISLTHFPNITSWSVEKNRNKTDEIFKDCLSLIKKPFISSKLPIYLVKYPNKKQPILMFGPYIHLG